MTDEFDAIKQRFLALHMKEVEFLARAGIDKVRYWRAKKGVTGEGSRTRALREAQIALAAFEALPASCGQCDCLSIDPSTWGCTRSDCGLRARSEQAA